ncbi:MAG: STAS domain-containing protein [Actinomycetota bacterium]|nr:STAS domain-containing protein [Actinomycetota bacterium]
MFAAAVRTSADPELVIDAGPLQFIDVAAAGDLAELAASLAPDRQIRLRRPCPLLVTVLELCGWDGTPGLVVEGSET